MINNQLKTYTYNENKIRKNAVEYFSNEIISLININENNIEKYQSIDTINIYDEINKNKKRKKEFLLINSFIDYEKICHNINLLSINSKKLIKATKINKRHLFIFFYLLSLIILFIPIYSLIKERTMHFFYSEIILKIKSEGEQLIINPDYNDYPNEIYIDENKVGENQFSITLSSIESKIKLKWFNNLTDCSDMFLNLSNIVEIDLSKFDSSQVTSTFSMFQGCYSLESINLTNFNTSKVVYMNYMFAHCIKLKSLDVSSFNTSEVTHMNFLFGNCTSLSSIDVTNFDTSHVNDMGYLFFNCWSLTSINLSNFNTKSNNYLDNMFYNCSLKSIDLSSFNTSNVGLMGLMFFNCTFLETLNLSNFDTSLVTNMNSMFYNCINLHYINLINSRENNDIKLLYLFEGVPENIVYCIDENNSPLISSILKNKDCSVLYCDNDWESKQKKMYLINNKYQCEISSQIIINFDSIDKFPNTESIEESCDEYDFYQRKCNDCIININISNNNLTNIIITRYLHNFINQTMSKNYIVNHYFNNSLNYTITIFDKWYCTNLLLEYDYFEINPNIIFNKLNNNLNVQNNYIFIYINMNYKNYIEIYNPSEIKKINIDSNCPHCFDEYDLKIKNNFTSEIYNELGIVIMDKIIKYNIDPFSNMEPIFNNICKNFTIEQIDIPIKERKHIMYLKLKEKELICNDINCIIEDYFLTNLTGICSCKISTNFDYLFNINEIDRDILEDYLNFINLKSKINSFLIFKCGKEAFKSQNLKKNAGFYISISLLILQLLFYTFFIIFYLYGKNNTKNNAKLNPPKIQKFVINDDFEEEEKEDSNKKNSEETNKKNKKIENNEIVVYVNSSENLNKDNIIIKQKNNHLNKSNISRNMKKDNKLKLLTTENDLSSFKLENKQMNTNINNKLNQIQIKINNKKRSLKNLPPIQKELITNKESLIKFQETTKEEKKVNVEKKQSKSFLENYWKLLSIKQQIINLFYPIKTLKIENSYIPVLVKLMRIIFMICLNIFFNVFHLDQKYFRKKYEHFNQKYNLIYKPLNNNISLNERFKYGFECAIFSGFISFIICFIIEIIFDYFIFNIKKKINIAKNPEIKNEIKKKKSINNKNSDENIYSKILVNNNKDLNVLLKKENKKYLIFFGIGIIIMLLIFYSIITFNEVYKGGISDLIPGAFWTFIFLQIIPCVYCLFWALIIIKKNE